ncbi:hypothetical protein [Chryseobacterium taiwanense]|uniref:RiboL-PSP-HEPN domain-containing protein n=1 Tax=Chryseobacterium taiwanense TaxID=363331 RepID=A0A0B4DHZ8_9FLAO|nr:hypothetical protein [Chryseobacterium taiwanense]KIC64060.1 hypothetical protein RM51_04910 [Chryseobacterium taiwanense]
MHSFKDLAFKSANFSLEMMKHAESKIIEDLQTNGSTVAVKNLQMIQVNKVIISIGIFSLFESMLQEGLQCQNGFEEAKKILINLGKNDLYDLFVDFNCAINVLKHGKGRSYDLLVNKYSSLPFRIKLPNEDFFNEGDVSEVATLIEVDDKFVLNCVKIIEDVSNEIRTIIPDFYY